MAKGCKKGTTLTSEEARKFAAIASRAHSRLSHLAETDEDNDLADALEEMCRRLWSVERQGRPQKYFYYTSSCGEDGATHYGPTVGEVLAIRAKDGEVEMLRRISDTVGAYTPEEIKKRSVSRTAFYRRLKQIREYAEEHGIDANGIEFWLPGIR